MDAPPWTATRLREWLATMGRERLQRRLGRFVLIGAGVEGDADLGGWSFTTGVATADAVDPPAPWDLANVVVHPVVKRSSTFFPTTILVGRASSNDVVIEHPSVSKLHARIRLVDHGFWVEDAGSHNGSAVDGETLARPLIAEAGDWIRFGEPHFLVLETPTLVSRLAEPPPPA